MNSFDSLKLKIPCENIDFFGFGNHKVSNKKQDINGNIVKEVSEVNNLAHGFNSFTYDALNNAVFLQVSAKILGDNYYQGINEKTFEQLHHELTRHGIFNIGPDELLQAQTLTIDCTNNIEVENLSKAVYSVIQHGTQNSNYSVKHYPNSGFIATRDVKTYKERLIGYSKLIEAGKKRKDYSKFEKDYPGALKKFTQNTLRIESNFTSFNKVRENFKIVGKPCLASLFQSQENVNSNLFEKVIRPGKQLILFSDRYDDLSFVEMIKEIGYITFFDQLNWDLKSVKEFIKAKYPRTSKNNKHSYYYELAEKKFYALKGSDFDETNRFIKEIEAKLKIA